MVSKSEDYPDLFELHRRRRSMALDQQASWALMTRSPSMDETTLPYGPMEYITRQAQGDFCVLDQRDDNLWMDAGTVTTQADWSLDFDIGMNFFEWHAPVPLAHEKGIFVRALKFLSEHSTRRTCTALELDDDGEPVAGHLAGKLPQMGCAKGHNHT